VLGSISWGKKRSRKDGKEDVLVTDIKMWYIYVRKRVSEKELTA
jgi:hypothetical protein